MAGEWIEKAIGHIAEVAGGSTPSTKEPANFDGDVPWLTPKDLSGPHPRYLSRGERNLSRKGLESCSAQLLPANAVLLSSRAPIGYLAIAANPIATNQGFRSLVLKPDYDHEFLYYWLGANVEELERHANGSTFKELSGTSLKQIRIRLPRERAEQRAIAHILGTLDDKNANGLESNKFEFKRGEILFGKLRPYFHKVGVAPIDGVCSTDIVVVAPKAAKWFGFVLAHVSSDAFVDYTTAGSTGTKMPRTTWGEMARYPVILPPEKVAAAFTAQMWVAVDRIVASIHESRTLAALRDVLLPKLISGEVRVGEVRVGDVGRIVGRAG